MKIRLSVLCLIVLALALCVCAAHAEALPTLDYALQKGLQDNATDGAIEVYPFDGLEEYVYENEGDAFADADGTKILILQREAPKKEFTELDSGYPDNYVEDFPDDFTGVDLGMPRVWVRSDLIRLLPAECRATSLEDADFIIIAETIYDWGGTLSVTSYDNDDSNEDIPDWVDTPEELMQYIAAHQPSISAIKYYPKFAVLSLISIFNADTKVCSYLDAEYYDAVRFARNPEAADLWSDMQDLETVISFIESDTNQENGDLICILIDMIADFDLIQPGETDSWELSILKGQYSQAIDSMNAAYWRAAKQLAALDDDEDHERMYQMVFEVGSKDLLSAIVGFFNYTGFDMEIDTIRTEELYLAKADQEWFEDNLMEIVEDLIDIFAY